MTNRYRHPTIETIPPYENELALKILRHSTTGRDSYSPKHVIPWDSYYWDVFLGILLYFERFQVPEKHSCDSGTKHNNSSSRTERWVHFQQNGGQQLLVHP